jgi:hypothetical protein
MHIVVEPLLRHRKHLTSDGKDKATELLFEAEQLRVETEAMLARLRAARQRATERAAAAAVHVAGMIYPGVEIRFQGMCIRIRTPLRGPVRIAVRDGPAGRQALAIGAHNKSAIRLEHEPVDDPTLTELDRLLAATAP